MTTTAILDRAGYEEIARQARQMTTGHALLLVVARFFFMIGWLCGRIVPCIRWCSLAVSKGYRASYGPSKRMQIAALSAQVADMKMQLSRFSG